MSSALDELIQAGHDVTSIKYYSVALTTLLFYDFFLTFRDEVRYAWRGKKSWVFAIFFLNRYLPMVYWIWVAVSNHSWSYTYEMCTKTAFIEILFFVWCTQVAQIILNIRLYAITTKNAIITGFFVCISASQFAVGMYLTILAAKSPAQRLPSINLTAYQLCVFTGHRNVEIAAHTALSLLYDSLAFLLIVFLAVQSRSRGFKMPGMLRAIVRDATVYFLVIFTSHFVLEMTLLLARPGLQLLPAIGNNVYLPIMINRLVLSLRKAADAPVTGWSLAGMTHTSNPGGHTSEHPRSMQFAPMSDEDTVLTAEQEISLATISSPMP